MESKEPARLTLRVTRQDKDGAVVSEERETECRPEDLAKYLGEPWEVARYAEPPEQALEALEEHLMQSLQLLECTVTEGCDAEGRRTWAVGWRKADSQDTDRAESPEPQGAETPGQTSDQSTAIAGRRSCLHVRTDNGERAIEMAHAANAMNVMHNSFCGVNWGNAYGIYDLRMELHIHTGESD